MHMRISASAFFLRGVFSGTERAEQRNKPSADAGFSVPLAVPCSGCSAQSVTIGRETALLDSFIPRNRTFPALHAPGNRLSTVGQL
jgi:hypothetical protein